MRAPVKRAAARRIIFGGTANWAVWDALDAARSEDDPMKLYKPATPWKSHIDFEGGLTQVSETVEKARALANA